MLFLCCCPRLRRRHHKIDDQEDDYKNMEMHMTLVSYARPDVTQGAFVQLMVALLAIASAARLPAYSEFLALALFSG